MFKFLTQNQLDYDLAFSRIKIGLIVNNDVDGKINFKTYEMRTL